MKNEEIQKFTSTIQEKLGKESANLILDDLGVLISDTNSMNSIITSKDEEIAKLKQTNEKLMSANASLFQQVGMSNSSNFKKEEIENDNHTTKSFSISDCFDEKRKL